MTFRNDTPTDRIIIRVWCFPFFLFFFPRTPCCCACHSFCPPTCQCCSFSNHHRVSTKYWHWQHTSRHDSQSYHFSPDSCIVLLPTMYDNDDDDSNNNNRLYDSNRYQTTGRLWSSWVTTFFFFVTSTTTTRRFKRVFWFISSRENDNVSASASSSSSPCSLFDGSECSNNCHSLGGSRNGWRQWSRLEGSNV